MIVKKLTFSRCNGRRYNFTDGIDPETQAIVPLFNPRKDQWSEHLIWSVDGQRIVGITSVGRATVQRLDLNDDWHDDGSMLVFRKSKKVGVYHE